MEKKFRGLDSFKEKNKVVIVRADFDVPVKDGEILDETKITAVIPTIQHLLKLNSKIVLISHLGEPNGEYRDDLSLMPVRFELGRQLTKQIKFVDIKTCDNSIKFMEFGDILLLENIKFHPEEESENTKTRKAFIKNLANLCDIYVNEAFKISKKIASVYDLPKHVKSYAGLNFVKEAEALNLIKSSAEKPFTLVVGGVSLVAKSLFIKNLAEKCDNILIGGIMSKAFLVAKKIVNQSNLTPKELKAAKEILAAGKKSGAQIVVPIDFVVKSVDGKVKKIKAVDLKNEEIIDIGVGTIKHFRDVIEESKTIVWNGPVGQFENEESENGTREVAETIALSSRRDAYKIVGGRDTLLALKKFKIKPKRISHVSVADESMIEYIGNGSFETHKALLGNQKI